MSAGFEFAKKHEITICGRAYPCDISDKRMLEGVTRDFPRVLQAAQAFCAMDAKLKPGGQDGRSADTMAQEALKKFSDAVAMCRAFIEGTLVIPGLLPGMKLGLANIVVMYALFFMGARQALVLDVLKALFVFLVSGFTAGFLSLCGGLLSLAVMWVLYYLLPVRPTWFILSVCGALAHNVGQLLGAGVIISSSLSLYYAPVMLVLGLVMGALTSVTLRALLPALGKMGFNTHENRPE